MNTNFFFNWLLLSTGIAAFWLDLQCSPFKSIHSSPDLLTSIKWSMHCWADCEFWRQRGSMAFQLELFWLEGLVIKLVTCGNILISWCIFRKWFFFSETLCHHVLLRISSLPKGTWHSFQRLKWSCNNGKSKYFVSVIFNPLNVNRESANMSLCFSWFLRAYEVSIFQLIMR